MTDEVTIAQAIKEIRQQLEEAQSVASGEKLRFLAKSVEVELSIVRKSEYEGSAGAKAWFVEASGKAKSASEASHKINLVLEPVGEKGKPVEISDRKLER